MVRRFEPEAFQCIALSAGVLTDMLQTGVSAGVLGDERKEGVSDVVVGDVPWEVAAGVLQAGVQR